jgi:O-antigen/teichoic acid export membrane protein
VILTSDNLIISSLLNPSEVTSYNNVYKIFQIYLVVSTVILTPLWTLYTDAFIKRDFKWIIKTIKNLNFLFVLMAIAVGITIYFAEDILFFWIKEKLHYSNHLFLFMGIFVLVRIYGDIYLYFLNGIGKIRLQLILFIIGAIINIPLSIFFVNKFDLGTSGVILATIISLFSFVILMPLQTYFILKNKDVFQDKQINYK